MRSLKGTGGLTHGSGMTETMINVWTLATPVTTDVYHLAMQDFTGVAFSTSDQHKKSTTERKEKMLNM